MKTMRTKRLFLKVALQGVLVSMSMGFGLNAHAAVTDVEDVLAIGDNADDSVKFFDVNTGNSLVHPAVKSRNSGLNTPAGILYERETQSWIVVSQNFNPADDNGEVLRYDADGKFVEKIVPLTDTNGPLAPRGIVIASSKVQGRMLLIADQGPNHEGSGKLLSYRLQGTKATFIANLDPNLEKHPRSTGSQFRPRGLVVGPDGYLYASLVNLPDSPCGGSIARFDLGTLSYKDTIVANPADCAINQNDLHRPEGLVFGPDGSLYVTSFRKDPTDNDKILIIRKGAGDRAGPFDRIDLDVVGGQRAFAQALLFGPGGNLFVPISGNGIDTGSVRRYNVDTKAFWTFISAKRGAGSPQYLSFRKTNPATLAYDHD